MAIKIEELKCCVDVILRLEHKLGVIKDSQEINNTEIESLQYDVDLLRKWAGIEHLHERKARVDIPHINGSAFARGCFSLDDLTVLSESIAVEKLTEKVFDESQCHLLEQLIHEKISGLEYCNVDDQGYLTISFYRNGSITDEQVKTVIECLNAL